MAVLATRHILRAMYGLAVVYTSRWTFNYKDKIGEDAIEVNTTKVSVTIFINSPLHSVKNIVAGVTFQFWAIFIIFVHFCTILDSLWQFLAIVGNFGQFLDIFGNFRQPYFPHCAPDSKI